MKNAIRKIQSPCCPVLLCCCAVMLLCSPASVGAAELPEAAKLVPPETILLADIDSFSQLRTNFEKTSVYTLYKDPAMAAFVDDFKTRWRETNKKQDNEFARIIADAGVLPQGRVVIAFVLGEQTKDTNEPPVLFISEWGPNIDKVRETMDKIIQKAIDDGARRETEDYRGTTITAVSSKPSEAFSYCFVDDCLMGSVDPDVLKFTIAQIKGAGSPTLADDADYNATMKTLGSRPGPARGRIDFYVNIKQIVRAAMAEDAEGEVKTMVSNLGFDNVTSLGCSIDLTGTAGGSSFAKAFLKIDGAKKGICRMLDIESAPLRVPRFISDSACSISFVNLNLEKAYNEFAVILNSFSPQFAAILYMPLLPPGPQGEPSLQLKGDMIDHLGSQIIIAQSIRKPSPDVGTSKPAGAAAFGRVESLLALAINNRNALEKSLSLLHGKVLAPDNPDARRELLGHTIYSVDVSAFLPMFAPSPPGQPGAPKPPPLAFTVTDTHLIFASEPLVERAIRALSSAGTVSLSSAEWYAKAKSTIPSSVGFAGLQDTAVSTERLWSGLRQAKKAATPGGREGQNQISIGMSPGSLFPMLDLTQAGSSLFDFGLLPEFDVVRKYFGLSAYYGVSRQDGFFFELKYLSPDASE